MGEWRPGVLLCGISIFTKSKTLRFGQIWPDVLRCAQMPTVLWTERRRSGEVVAHRFHWRLVQGVFMMHRLFEFLFGPFLRGFRQSSLRPFYTYKERQE